MGKIKRQGLSVSVILYLGLILGFVNTGVLFPKIFPEEVYGYAQFLVKVSGLLSIVSLLGLPILTIRYFPTVRNDARKHDGYFMGLMLTGIFLTAIVAGILLLFQDNVIAFFQKGSEENDLIREFYWGIIAWFVINNLSILLTSYSTALQRPRVPAFFIEIGGRVVTLSLLLLYYFQVFDQDTFIGFYAVKQIFVVAGIVLFLMVIGEFHWHFSTRFIRRFQLREWTSFSIYSSFSQLGDRLTVSIDTIMVTRYLGLAQTGIYNLFQYLTTVMILSHRGMGKIASALIAEYWSDNRIDKIEGLYKRMAINNLVIAVLVYIGILANLENAILFFGESYEEGRNVAVFIGAAQLLHVLNGYNGMILIYSPIYRYTLYFKLITVALTVVTNIVLIPWLGVSGAALATALTILVTNALSQWLVYRQFRIHSFSKGMITIIGVGILVGVVISLIPQISQNFFIDSLLRSLVLVFMYISLILYLSPAPDINEFAEKYWKRMASRIK
jgi:O-antigen/teichoic acid export membrane protein